MNIRPIFSALRRHKTAAALIVLEIAVSCAVLSNAVFLIHTHLQLMHRPTGMAETELVRIQLANPATDDNAAARTREDLAALRALPGVRNAAAVNFLPLGSLGRSLDVRRSPDEAALFETAYYAGDDQLIDAMGLNLIAGRRFTPDEFVDWEALTAPNSQLAIPSAIVSRSMAEKLFPGQDPLGKSFYAWGDTPITIVGVVEHLVQPHGANGPASYTYAMLMPVEGAFRNYLLRVTDPTQRGPVLERAADTLKRLDPNRLILRNETVEEMRDSYYRKDVEMAWLLAIVCAALLAITALGIVGLASFWVQQRTKQIGIRRALGATRRQILGYFQTENLLLATLGILLGMIGAYGINQFLMSHYELPRLPAIYLPVGAIALWLLGQIAVFGPARRAAQVPPAVATRSV